MLCFCKMSEFLTFIIVGFFNAVNGCRKYAVPSARRRNARLRFPTGDYILRRFRLGLTCGFSAVVRFGLYGRGLCFKNLRKFFRRANFACAQQSGAVKDFRSITDGILSLFCNRFKRGQNGLNLDADSAQSGGLRACLRRRLIRALSDAEMFCGL